MLVTSRHSGLAISSFQMLFVVLLAIYCSVFYKDFPQLIDYTSGCRMVNSIKGEKVNGRLMLYGSGISNASEKEFLEQLCPKPKTSNNNKNACHRDYHDRKYVRIKTYNNKYVYVYGAVSTDDAYLKTRCCGGKDAVGRKDVTVPGKRTTFLIHCNRVGRENTVRFEILKRKNNEPSGYYFYEYHRGLYVKECENSNNKFDFVLKRWRGPVVAIRTTGRWPKWLTFEDKEGTDGRVEPMRRYPSETRFPGMADTFTLEAVPSGCVDAAANRDNVWAAPKGTGHEECESKPDRCFWTEGWDYYHKDRMLPGTCYYEKGTMCYLNNPDDALLPDRVCKVTGITEVDEKEAAAKCETVNCCYDYKGNKCYKPKPK